MADERKIAISARDTGVRELLEELKREGQSVTEDMIRQLQEYTSHVEDLNDALKEQIELLKQRGAAAGLGGDMGGRAAGGAITMGAGGEGPIPVIDEAVLGAIRELITVTTSESRDTQRTETKNTDTILADDAADDLRDKQDRDKDKSDEQRDKDETKTKEKNHTGEVALGTIIGNYISGISNRLASLAETKNEYHLAAAMVNSVPLVGDALAGLMNKSFDAAEAAEAGTGSVAALLGVGNTGAERWARGGGVYYGRIPAEMSEIEANAIKASGSTEDSRAKTFDYLKLQQGFDFEPGTIMSLFKALRLEKGALGDTSQLVSTLATTTGIKSEDTALLEEFTDTFIAMTQDQLTRLDRIDAGVNAKIIGQLAKMGGSFAEPEVLKSVISSINAGLVNPQNNYAQALSFHLLGQQNPTASRMELLEKQEEGAANLGLFLDFYKGQTAGMGEKEQFNIMWEELYEQFGGKLSPSHSKRLLKGYLKTGFVPELTEEEKEGKWTETEMVSRATDAVGALEVSTAKFAENFSMAGEELLKAADKLKEAFTASTGFFDFFDKLGTALDSLGTAISNLSGY